MTPSAEESGIKALDLDGLKRLVRAAKHEDYRSQQLTEWLYQHAVSSYDEMGNLPKSLREFLKAHAPLSAPKLISRQISSADGTRKYLFALGAGAFVESVGLPSKDRLTVCFSTQIGCRLGCTFCATGLHGFVRDLLPGEMVDQVNLVARDFRSRATNAVAMGQGEPFANYAHTMAALRILNSPAGPGIGARHITVSTCGLLEGIRKFAKEPEQFTLAVSLHSAVQSTRNRLMPGVRNQPLLALRSELTNYIAVSGRRPTLEFALLQGVNDTTYELESLIDFSTELACHINLIPANPVPGGPYRPSPGNRVSAIESALKKAGIQVSVRTERGADIDAACGQLKGQHETRPHHRRLPE
ncbi:MAG: 23S rRNA (adenine(2503)-C(2))-methyltransferase RlmN [Actinobacteria bacterium]|nr:23S rRNA (adenine(2503)-C(2))-methyltransferase RlmN [Actinomycetota bacterium]